MRRVMVIFSLAFGLSIDAQAAGFPVFDPANLAQNLLSAYRQFQQLEQTAARIEYEVKAAQRLAKKMKNFKLTNLRDLVSQINQFRSRARSIGYAYDGISNQFEKLYGRKNEFTKNFKAWQNQSDDSLKDAMVSQGLLEKSQKHMADLDKIVDEKRKSKGDAETLQAIGEINAIQSKQLADLSQIVASDARAKNSVMMEERAKEKELKNYENHLMKDFNKHEKSHPLNHFPSLGTTAPRR
jgi:P-type conjugative transfer protein TrbJ